MLVLTRRVGESLRIGSEVRVTVLSSGGGQIRLGIDAPSHVAVHRQEVYDRIVDANLEAAHVGELDVAELWPTGARAAGGEDG